MSATHPAESVLHTEGPEFETSYPIAGTAPNYEKRPRRRHVLRWVILVWFLGTLLRVCLVLQSKPSQPTPPLAEVPTDPAPVQKKPHKLHKKPNTSAATMPKHEVPLL